MVTQRLHIMAKTGPDVKVLECVLTSAPDIPLHVEDFSRLLTTSSTSRNGSFRPLYQ